MKVLGLSAREVKKLKANGLIGEYRPRPVTIGKYFWETQPAKWGSNL